MSTLFVRYAEASEEPLWRVHRESARQEASRYRGEPWSPTTADRAPGGQEQMVVVVAGVGDTVFGSISAHESEPSRWWIDHVFVEDEARQVGLGDALMSFLLAEITGRGAAFVGSSAQPGDRALKNLYERHGLVARTILAGKDLSGPSSGESSFR